ncbi:MAG: hypothetical protein AAF823_02465 [Planctomycetota bacterium]
MPATLPTALLTFASALWLLAPGHAAAEAVLYAATGQGGREYSVFKDASTNAGSTPAGSFRVGFNGDGRERQYVGKFNLAIARRSANDGTTATLRLFAGSSTELVGGGFDFESGPHTQASGVTVGVFVDATAPDASARIDPRFPKPEGGTYRVADSEFVDVSSAGSPIAAFSADTLREGVSVDITQAFHKALSQRSVLRVVLAPVSPLAVENLAELSGDRGTTRDQTYIVRSSRAEDVPEHKRLRIELSAP